jgi:hypothetical protein
MDNYLNTVRHINVFNTLVNGLNQRINYKGQAKFDEIVDSIKDYVMEEIFRGYDIIADSGDPSRFPNFLALA